MRGLHVRGDPTYRSMLAAGQILNFARGGKIESAQRSKEWCGRYPLDAVESVPPKELQEVLWKHFFADTAQWWDNRRSKRTPQHPDFRHKQSKVPLWLDNRHKPVWVDSQLATLDAGPKSTLEENSATCKARAPRVLAATEVCLQGRVFRKLCDNGSIADVVDELDQQVQRGNRVSTNLYYRVLKRCIQNKDLVSGRRIHALSIQNGYEGDAFLSTHLIGLYASHGRLEEAMGVFTKVSTPDAYNWATIIFAYARHGAAVEAAMAIRLYRQMCASTTVRPDDCLYLAVLTACVAAKDLAAGKEVHYHILASSEKLDALLQARLVNMYAKCGSIVEARRVFDRLTNRSVVTWTAMIAAYAKQGMGQEALNLYNSMRQEGLTPDSVTYVCLLQACASVGGTAFARGKQLHAQIEEQGLLEDPVLGGSLVNMYAKCGSLEDARRVFDELPDRNVVSWTAMISGYAQQGMGQKALTLHSIMEQEGLTPNSVTYNCLLQACAAVGAGALHRGKQLHAQIEERGLDENTVLAGSLVDMYAKCGSLVDARRVFDKLSDKNVIAWTAMIAGYVQQGMGQEVLNLHSSMRQEGLIPDSVTYACLLQACASLGFGGLSEGKQLHVQIEERGLEEDAVLGGSLVNMYVKCGSVSDARKLFDKLPHRNVVAWTAMVSGYAQQAMGQEALSLYNSMQLEGLRPDSVTYVCLLQACGSLGVAALREGKQLHAQIQEQGLEVDRVLGCSLVDMYAKCGSLEDARRVFDELSDRNVVGWTAMIAGYAQHGMGQEASSLYSSMKQQGLIPNSVTYTCLLHACAAATALPLGVQLHAELVERGMQVDGDVGAALVSMYAKCGSICDSRKVFDSLSERSIHTWNGLISGYALQGDSQVVFDLLDRMRLEGINANETTFLSVLSVCSHVGLVGKGQEYFKVMRSDYGICPTMEHYICLVDLLGRAGHLHAALQTARNMPFPPNETLWHTLLGACRKWKNVEIGQQAFMGAVSLDEKDSAAYVLMSNIFASTQMWEASKEMLAMRMKLGARKEPGQSWWTDIGGVVHTFFVGDTKHPDREGIYGRLQHLMPRVKKEDSAPHSGVVIARSS